MAQQDIAPTDNGADSLVKIESNFTELYGKTDKITNASASAPASIDLAEDTDNGTNKITLTAPSAIASDKVITLPDASGILALLETVYPVGSYYFNGAVTTNPATLFGFGTWVAIAGKVLVGYSAGEIEFDTLLETGGEKTHLLTGAESGEKGHNHSQNSHAHSGAGGSFFVPSGSFYGLATATGYSTGSTTATNIAVETSNASSAHNNLQPYEVAAMWRRTA